MLMELSKFSNIGFNPNPIKYICSPEVYTHEYIGIHSKKHIHKCVNINPYTYRASIKKQKKTKPSY